MKNYYYLKGPNKTGPINEEELIALNLSHETLIWTEGFENWTPLSEIPELIKIIPPPTPLNILNDAKDYRKSKKRKNFTILFLTFMLISIFTIIGLTKREESISKKELENRIETIFNGKSVVSDAIHSMVTGNLTKVNNTRDIFLWNTKKENLEMSIIEKFNCLSGGFTYKKLEKVDDGYEVYSIISTNMAYKRNPFSYKPSIESAYNNAYNYFKNENSSSYQNGSYDLITNFAFLKNELFQVENVKKPSHPYSTHWWSADDGYFNYDYQILYYRTEGYYYEIKPIVKNINNFIILLSLKIFFVMFVVFLLLYYSNPFKW